MIKLKLVRSILLPTTPLPVSEAPSYIIQYYLLLCMRKKKLKRLSFCFWHILFNMMFFDSIQFARNILPFFMVKLHSTFLYLVVLRVGPGALCMLGKYSVTELLCIHTIFSLFLRLLRDNWVNSYFSCCEQSLNSTQGCCHFFDVSYFPCLYA